MKKVILASFVALLIIASIAIGYIYYQRLKTPDMKALQAVPRDAAFLVEMESFSKGWNALKNSALWKELQPTPFFSQLHADAGFLDSACASDPELATYLSNRRLFISAHPQRDSSMAYLFLVELPKTHTETFVREKIKNITGQMPPSSHGKNGYPVIATISSNNGRHFVYAVWRGLFIASTTPALLEASLYNTETGQGLSSDRIFLRVHDAAGQHVPANIFVNSKNFFLFAEKHFSSPLFSSHEENSSSWSGLDFSIKPGLFQLNGLTVPDSASAALDIFRGQKPGDLTLSAILPSGTALFVYKGLSDFLSYYRTLHTNKNDTTFQEKLKKINNQYALSLEDLLVPWMGNEQALVITEPTSTDYSTNVYAVLHTNDSRAALKSLRILNQAAGENAANQPAEESYRNHTIGYVNIPGLLPLLMGDLYSPVDRFFYTIHNDYVIVANQASALRSYIDNLVAQKLLTDDPSFKTLSDHLSASSNVLTYMNVRRSANLLKAKGSARMNALLGQYGDYVQKVNELAFQMTYGGTSFYTSIVMQYGQPAATGKKSAVEWIAQLDTSVSSPPQLVTNHRTGEKEIIVQDDANNLYLLSSKGDTLWKRKLPERVMSRICQTDIFKNKKLQYLFNTKSKIYAIDRKGRNVEKYPIDLPADATNPIAVFDYDSTGDYRIFVACRDNRLHVYNAKTAGKVEGWGFREKVEEVRMPVHHFTAGGKDMIVFADKKGTFFLLDRKGKEKASVKASIPMAARSTLSLVNNTRDPEKSYLVTTDTTGRVWRIFPDGRTENFSFPVKEGWSSSHGFVYQDVNADHLGDYIFTDRNTLVVYNNDRTLLFRYEFSADINPEAACFIFPNRKGKVGVTAVSSGEQFLFNDDGSLYKGFPIKGSTPFFIENLPDTGIRLITGGDDHAIFSYLIGD